MDRNTRIVLLLIIGVIAITGMAIYKKNREAKEKEIAIALACASNQRVMLGAVEMYNMDHSDMMQELNINELLKPYKSKYSKQSFPYLKSDPSNNKFGCEYTSQGDLTRDGNIICKKHGTVEEIMKKYRR